MVADTTRSALSQITPIWVKPFDESPEPVTIPLSARINVIEDDGNLEGVLPPLPRDAMDFNIVQSHACFTPDEVLSTRNALKLATKFFADKGFSWGPDQDLPFSAHLAEAGTLLTMAECSAEVVQAGLLYPALSHPGLAVDRALGAVQKKFSPQVNLLVAEVGSIFYTMQDQEQRLNALQKAIDAYPEKATDIATLYCAIDVARIGAELDFPTKSAAAEFQLLYMEHGVPALLCNQYAIEAGNSSSIIPQRTETDDCLYSLHESIDIRNGLRAATVVFKNSMRKWGPDEFIPLISHAAEVGMLLIMAKQPRNTVVAGFLHDFLERYVDKNQDELGEIVDRFGDAVRGLVTMVTEPERNGLSKEPETLDAWLTRKMAIINRLEEGTTEFAELCAATKISTLAAGNKMLYEGGAFNRWSNGPIDANIDIFIAFRDAYSKTGQNPLLSEQLDLEISRLILQSVCEKDGRLRSHAASA